MQLEPAAFPASRDEVRGALKVPSRYFLERGFGREVLDAFDVGDSAKLGRAVVPLYDEPGEFCLGYTTRSTRPECRSCRKYHDPDTDCRWGQQKWGIMKGFPKRAYLYNLAAARASDSPFLFLVEGPPDVWRVQEAGHVAVALLGADATEEQLETLASLGRTILVAFDDDSPGRAARERFQGKRVGFPWAFFPVPGGFTDIGETPVEELRRAVQALDVRA